MPRGQDIALRPHVLILINLPRKLVGLGMTLGA
jgi:hypothetical protein